jgi:hypothetical protein
MACLPRATLKAVIDNGCLSKAEITAINALRAGGSGRNGEVIAKRRLEAAITKQFAERSAKTAVQAAIGDYAYQRAAKILKEARPVTTAADLLEERVSKARADVQMLRDTVRKYQAAHPNVSRANAIDAVLFGPSTREIVDLNRRLDDAVAKLGVNRGSLPQPDGGPGIHSNTLPQPRHTGEIDFSNPLRGTAGYDASLDGRRPARAWAGGGPQSGEEDQPVIEDANDVLERLTKAGMAAGKSRAKAMSDAAMSPEFSDAHRKERARKFGV